ncbi:hypothetical protein OAB85_05345 [Pseudomonadales bacterium]|nr:hypothetical protein [Pseudomonadales bacterium]
MLTIHCKCDSVAIEWPHKKVLWQLECCCNECTTRIQYLHAEKHGPQPPAHQLLDGIWLKNDFTILKGLENIGAFKLSPTGRTTCFYCSKCATALLADHIIYKELVVITQVHNFMDFDGLRSATLLGPQARHFMRDLTANQRDRLPPFKGSHGALYEGVSDSLVEVFPELYKKGGTGIMNAQRLAEITGVSYLEI